MRFDDVTVIVRFHAFFSPFKNNACYVPGASANPQPQFVLEKVIFPISLVFQRLYTEENLGMVQIAEQPKRSSRTPKVHIDSHNAAVKRSCFCAACKRAKGALAQNIVERKQF